MAGKFESPSKARSPPNGIGIKGTGKITSSKHFVDLILPMVDVLIRSTVAMLVAGVVDCAQVEEDQTGEQC